MIRIYLGFLMLASSLAIAGEKTAYQNWTAEIGGKTNEAYTIADPNTSLGMFCGGDQCLFYLHQSLNCSPGVKYSVLMNSPSVSTALSMECTQIGGNVFQILTPFDAVFKAVQAGDSIGFAVALQSGAFAVTRFSLLGAKAAIDRVLNEAVVAKSKAKRPELRPVPPTSPPPAQITPKLAPKIAPKPAPKPAPKSSSEDIST